MDTYNFDTALLRLKEITESLESGETDLEMSMKLYEEGVYANSSIPPATAPNECLIRTSLMATHTKPLIDEATEIIAKVISEN